jgi:hypothetical protein
MAVFYHLDRQSSLQAGQKLTLHPNGYSFFGNQYPNVLAGQNLQLSDLREHELEVLRKAHFPNIGSRLTSIFAALSVADAIAFGSKVNPAAKAGDPIFEIHAQVYSVHDMNWADWGGSATTVQQRVADHLGYWSSQPLVPPPWQRPGPIMEAVIQLPATVGNIVATYP